MLGTLALPCAHCVFKTCLSYGLDKGHNPFQMLDWIPHATPSNDTTFLDRFNSPIMSKLMHTIMYAESSHTPGMRTNVGFLQPVLHYSKFYLLEGLERLRDLRFSPTDPPFLASLQVSGASIPGFMAAIGVPCEVGWLKLATLELRAMPALATAVDI